MAVSGGQREERSEQNSKENQSRNNARDAPSAEILCCETGTEEPRCEKDDGQTLYAVTSSRRICRLCALLSVVGFRDESLFVVPLSDAPLIADQLLDATTMTVGWLCKRLCVYVSPKREQLSTRTGCQRGQAMKR